MEVETIVVAHEWEQKQNIPSEFKDLYQVVPQSDILASLNTDNKDYIAASSFQKGCTNSAQLTEEIVAYLLQTYPSRFQLFEHTFVNEIELYHKSAALISKDATIDCQNVILCTNGFENFSITNKVGDEINTGFHHLLTGYIGFMSGYIEDLNSPPTAVSYFPKTAMDSEDDAYFYMTRRPYKESATIKNLICVGGPGISLPNQAIYSRENLGQEEAFLDINDFLCNNYRHYPATDPHFAFNWHGLMGYTPNGIRRVGFEPKNKVLLYNLGCNGVGILPSTYGATRIADLLNGKNVRESIFDPQ